jgi:hypothetical protein
MSYTLKVVFRGLMVLVPSDVLSNDQPWFGAFLVNADLDTLGGLGSDRTLKLHFPFIRYDVADLKGVPAGVDGEGLWELAGEDVVIRPATSPGGPLHITHSPTGTIGTQPAAGEERFFDWVPRVSDLLGNGAVHPDCLSAQPIKGLVVARIHLQQGQVQTETLSSFNNEGAIIQFSPVIAGGIKVHRVIATSVSLEMPNLQGDLKLRARKFDGSHPRELVFAEPASGGTLSIEVLNLCSDELLGQPPRFPGVDSDFAWNYLATDAGNQRLVNNLPLSLPVAVQFDPGDAGGGEYAHCTHPQAAPASAAGLATMLTVSQF